MKMATKKKEKKKKEKRKENRTGWESKVEILKSNRKANDVCSRVLNIYVRMLVRARILYAYLFV